MQLKGLVRFFTVLLIIYSLYQLSFTWFVQNHEKKLQSKAKAYVAANYQTAQQKFPGNKDSQQVYQEFLDKKLEEKLSRLEDSTKDQILTWGINGGVSYQKAKSEELNLGLDLKGGLNVTLEVEMTGLLRSLANNSKDPNFEGALLNADKNKKNSGADFITLFIDEYRKLEPTRPLASLFAAASSGKIDITSSDSKVLGYIREEAKGAFDRTYKVLRTRIDQFGVAQPNINPNSDKQIITVELPGIKNVERARNVLQATANLQFWETYTFRNPEMNTAWNNAFDAYKAKFGTQKDTTVVTPDSASQPGVKNDTANNAAGDTSLAKQLGLKKDTAGAKKDTSAAAADAGLGKYIQIVPPTASDKGGYNYSPYIGYVLINDSAEVRRILTELRSSFPSDVLFAYGTPEKASNLKKFLPLYCLRTYGRAKSTIEGDVVTDAKQDYEQNGSRPIVLMDMNSTGASEWEKITRKSAEKQIPIAITLDNIVYSAPIAEGAIGGGKSRITGNFTVEDAKDLANILKAGKLPAPAKIVAEQQIGATLGDKAIKAGSLAFLISFVVIFLLMLVYYNTSGWIANIALILNLLFTVGILAGLGGSLTAPGIAGLVLTIGMAVDTNVIIYERIKEELNRGKGYIPAINEGYKRSLPPVLDAHVTTFLTAVILFSFGLGPVKGFATTQMIGILLSLFCGILVSRWVTEWFTNKQKHLEYFTSISKRVFKHAKYKFIEYRKVAYVISMIVLALGIASFFNGFDEGVEFKGGRSYKIAFGHKVDVEQVRTDLRATFGGESPIIKTIGDNATLDITTAYLIEDNGNKVDSIIESKLIVGLANYLPKGITYDKFDKEFKQESKKVLPSISDDLKRGAVKATIFALLVIFLYILVRFRDWRYSLGTIVALLHDVFVTLAVFSFARGIVPFPLEIDQHFIAAILTVIGFSMNDTVIVFDRIREYSRNLRGVSKVTIINRAINDTLSRTIMTSLTVFLTILILFIVGGEVTKGFAFAMLIGVVTGTYSSIFVAAPILVDLSRKKPLGEADKHGEVKAKE